MKLRIAIALFLITTSVAIAYRIRIAQQSVAPASLTAYVPPDALLIIESPDFSSLLHQWTNSAECKSWLASDNHSVFQNSRLFGRLSDAQTSFATAAGIPVGVDLLHEIAGKQSVFAWYDIGKLEFLYITRMPAGQADQTSLFQARSTFQRRHAGNSDFYIRTSGTDYSTVAFARVPSSTGDLVLLATREDLMANALTLLAASSSANSVAQEPWFRDVSAALPAEKSAPALHMVLNLDRIAVDPHFRSYWIQRNVTWTQQFRAAASDLYIESKGFREERVLLLKPTAAEPATLNLAPLATLPPPATGIYRVVVTHDPCVAVTAIQEKLLGTSNTSASNPESAPDPTTDAPQSGSATDLETRIDSLPPVSPTSSTDSLKNLFQTAGLDAVLTLSSAQNPSDPQGLWIPIHTAIVLHTANPADQQALASALEQTLRGQLTTASIGINFQPRKISGVPISALTGPRHLFFAVASTPATGNLILLADDESLLSDLLHNLATNSPASTPLPATSIAVFKHSTQRAPYLRLTSLIDGTNHSAPTALKPAATAPDATTGEAPTAPAFFSQNLGSLSNTFADLESERAVERLVDSNLRQTVTYTWQTH
jgi:hypothetical protein